MNNRLNIIKSILLYLILIVYFAAVVFPFVVSIFNFLGIWNEYLFALVFISDDRFRTLPLGLANLMMVMQYEADWGALFAGLVIVTIPTLIVYSLLQGRLTKGITVGALKG